MKFKKKKKQLKINNKRKVLSFITLIFKVTSDNNREKKRQFESEK